MTARVIHWYRPVVNASGEGWTPHWVAQLKATNPLEVIRQRYIDAEQTRQLLAPHLPPQVVVQAAPPSAGQSPGQPAATVPADTCTLHAALDAFVESVRG